MLKLFNHLFFGVQNRIKQPEWNTVSCLTQEIVLFPGMNPLSRSYPILPQKHEPHDSTASKDKIL